jgi:replicative DNA helicase
MADAAMYNVEAEKEILSVIISKPNKLYDISRIIKADDFYRETNRLIYQTVAEMVIADEPLDMVNLSERLKRDGNLDKIGGLGVITDICQPEFVANVEAQAKIVADYAQRRRLIEKARMLATLAQDMNQEPDEVACQIAEDISGLTAEASENTKTAKDGVMDFASLIDKRAKRKGELLNTGLTDIDAKIKSFEAGQLIVIAGRPGHGKTALAGTIAVNMALRGKKILMFSMEMSHEELLGRFVSRLGGISGEKLKEPSQMTPDDWSAYVTALNSVGELPIAINSQGDLTPADVANVATRWQRHNGLDVIMIDYLQLMSSGKKTDSRVQEVSYITRTLKNLAVRLKLPIILLSQLSRANDKENRAPKLTDLRDSGTIEQDANTVLLIHRETSLSADKKTIEVSNKTYVNIAKQRDGSCGTVMLTFIPTMSYFANYIDDGHYGKDVPY